MLRLCELRESLAAIQNKNGLLWNICMGALLWNRKRFDIHALVWLSSKDFSLLIHCICCMPISGYCALWYLANSTVISEAMQPGPLIPHFWVNSPGFNRVHWLFFPHMCCCNLPWMIFFKMYSFIWVISKVFIEFVTILFLLFLFCFFDPEACGILTPWPGIKPAPPALEGEVLTARLPGKSSERCFKIHFHSFNATAPDR